jgi:hypothetical protein
MKPPIPALAAALLLPFTALAEPPANPDSKALAFGYAAAFEAMNKSSVAILYLNAGQSETIKDVSGITAFGSVLLVKTLGGGKQILDAARVIKITDNS